MESYRSARQFGISLILFTLLFRLFAAGLPQGMLRKLKPRAAPDILIETQTGRDVRSFSVPQFLPFIAESSPPQDLPQRERPIFAPEDAETVAVVNTGSAQPDYAALIAAPLNLDLTGWEPTVLIVHTHTTESYTPTGEGYAQTAAFRTLDETANMLSIGDRVAALLEEGGIHVVHDRELHDYPAYNGAYNHARKAIQAILAEYPSIQLVLDLHRDAAEVPGGQLRTEVQLDGQTGAQLMLVMGSGSSSLRHPRWEENLSLALKLQVLLERANPGICRPMSLRPQRYNQDLSPGMLLVEVGAAGNTHPEALLAAEALAQAILCL